MANRTAPVVKLTLTLTQILPGARVRRRHGARHGGQTGKNRHFSLNHFTAMEN